VHFPGAALRVDVTGLVGGHSGTEINKGRANADMLLGRVLLECADRVPLRIVSVSGGLKDNAIPAAACATLIAADEAALRAVCAEMDAAFRNEYCVTDPLVTVRVSAAEAATPLDEESTRRVLCLLTCAPNGIQTMSADIEGLVQTSLNLGILTTDGDNVTASFSVRSSVESQKKMLVDRLRCLMRQLGGSVSIRGDYPGWAYRQESPLRELMSEVFTAQYGHPPVIEAIHAGLECGLFSGKIPGLDCVSIGPDLTDIHTFREKLHIASTARTWALLTEVLKRMK
jgi:dipeptidase D